MIQLKNVSKSYNKGAVQAVKNLTLTVEPGKLFLELTHAEQVLGPGTDDRP